MLMRGTWVMEQMEGRPQPHRDIAIAGAGTTPEQQWGHEQGWKSSSDSITPSVLGRVCQKGVSCQEQRCDLWPRSLCFLFHLPHLLFLPYLHIETKPSPQLVPSYCQGGSVSVTLGSAEVQWGGAGSRLEMPVCLPNCHPRCFRMRMSAEITLRLGITRRSYSLTSTAD